ncbi:RNA polymerase sigma factor [Roseinatronobacter bogoriensis]|uniref:RNA polymerase sigma factor n=1 Tax=Roseinatronobacter bogoriensis subsp. barguzinensis TaxID=441209 RepID=A0A2K8KBV1_9RHOB|nr:MULTISPECIES: RNA polymerase sigma factor [Rhodobaca]ATX65393.1 RNA polymerase subunit sigma [Rhodobaca barguzinensis]MBB4208977.1 RNA polymerase sigma-70 factor (ECF subfamily) [Rhodobaca bogoriensis DSM 18756]TDW37598.1 RNA polymerase sigma-70 factor (ECF subfamily) [Rhodobaca barguzinensis]TDY68208.1 RNA polymerase sigma-70 factor (ECF subfamily) [Rhodobaca bogoriensis DSM 18756]
MTTQKEALAPTDPRDEIVTHLPALRAFARGLTGNVTSADDLVQDTVLKAWSKFDQFKEGTNLRAWLFTILRNTFLSQQRKRAKEVSDSTGSFAAKLASKPDHDGRMALQELNDALKTLPVEQREALLLVGALGFSVEEAAETCGCAPGTIKSRANRGRKTLAELLNLDREDQLVSTDSSVAAVMAASPTIF